MGYTTYTCNYTDLLSENYYINGKCQWPIGQRSWFMSEDVYYWSKG